MYYRINNTLPIIDNIYNLVFQEYKEDLAIAKMQNKLKIYDKMISIGDHLIELRVNYNWESGVKILYFFRPNEKFTILYFTDKINIKEFRKRYEGQECKEWIRK